MRKFEDVQLELISFVAEDVITTSPPGGGIGGGAFDSEDDEF